MATIEKRIFLWGKMFLLIGGAMLASYSWVTTFADVPPIIKDWRLGVGLGLFLLFIGVGWTILDLYRKYVWWAEPDVTLMPYKKDSTDFFGEATAFALLRVTNNEEIAITDCYATLEQATNLYGGHLIHVPIRSRDRLRWAESKYSTEDCKIVIPSKDYKDVHVANQSFRFAYCKDSGFHPPELLGIHLVKIRIDGKLNDKDMKPLFFEGHLLMDRVMSDSGVHIRTAFASGDWTQNKDIPEWYRERKALNDKNEQEHKRE